MTTNEKDAIETIDINRIIREILKEKNLTFAEFTKRYNQRFMVGEKPVSVQGLNTKLCRKTFKAIFFIECLSVLDIDIKNLLEISDKNTILNQDFVRCQSQYQKSSFVYLAGENFKKDKNKEDVYFLNLEKPFLNYEINDILVYEKIIKIEENEQYLFNFFNEVLLLKIEKIEDENITIDQKKYTKDMINGLLLGKLLYGIKKY